MRWKKIDTAPKDGTEMLLFIEGKVIQGYWYAMDWHEKRGVWEVARVHSHGCGCCSSENEEPTHWAPLQAPKAKGE